MKKIFKNIFYSCFPTKERREEMQSQRAMDDANENICYGDIYGVMCIKFYDVVLFTVSQDDTDAVNGILNFKDASDVLNRLRAQFVINRKKYY